VWCPSSRKSAIIRTLPSKRYRYGAELCDGDRLPKDALEDAVIEQMVGLYSDSALIAETLAGIANEEATVTDDTDQRRAAITQELAGARRALDRYFAAFEEGSLSPADCRERVARLKDRIESLEAEEQALLQRAAESLPEPVTADDIAQWAKELDALLRAGSAQQRKSLMRILIKELRVMGRELILPTYKIPALVRAPEGQVDPDAKDSNRVADPGRDPAARGLSTTTRLPANRMSGPAPSRTRDELSPDRAGTGRYAQDRREGYRLAQGNALGRAIVTPCVSCSRRGAGESLLDGLVNGPGDRPAGSRSAQP
jgi:hypothetical protein